MHRINVLHIYKFYLPYVGGIERTIQIITEGLKDKAIESRILVCASYKSLKSKEEEIGTIRVSRANSLGTIFSTPLSPSFLKLFRSLSKDADILHIHSPFPLGEVAYLLLNPKNKRLVVTYHADISQTRWACFAPYYEWISKKLLERADCIILTSQYMVNSSPQLHRFLNKCKVIPLGIDLNKWGFVSKEKKRDLKRRLAIGSHNVILYVGRLVYYKGLNYLINSMQDINAILVIIGEGELKEQLKEEAIKLGVSNKIQFLGQMPDEELPVYYSIADVFVLPSINGGEAFGLVQLEAMAFGIPVINTDLPTGVPFVSLHNETGLTVPPRNSVALAKAINTILEDDLLRQRFSENARRRVMQFSMDEILNQTYKVYAEVMEKTSQAKTKQS